ncbi:MAG: hypothetical protein LJF06_16990 [Gemmatimonadetes bacterium]|nr:hypothetical protein [Gemmatimonadota bacterium]
MLPRALIHNWRLKLAALGLSVLLWALVQTEPRNAETLSAIPVDVMLTDTAWALAGPPQPRTVELRLSGPTGEIIRLAREGTAVRIPIGEVGSNDTTVTLHRDWVELGNDRGISVESVTPPSVHIAFESAVSRAVPLALEVKGALPERLALASPIGLNPQLVRVRGPASRVEGLDSIPLKPLDLSRVNASGVFEVQVDTTGLGGGRVTPPTATVGVRVDEKIERTLSGVPVLLQAATGDPTLSVAPDTISVTLRGARTLVDAVNAGDLGAWVTSELVKGMAKGEERHVPVRIEGVPDLVSAQPATDMVTVRRAPAGGGEGHPGRR